MWCVCGLRGLGIPQEELEYTAGGEGNIWSADKPAAPESGVPLLCARGRTRF